MKYVFITGHIKTGTSLLASLLDDHPELVLFPEELFLMSKYIKLKRQSKQSLDDFWYLFFKDEQIKRLFRYKSEGLFGKVDYTNFNAEEFKNLCLSQLDDKAINRSDIAEIYKVVFNSYCKIQNLEDKRIWVEKTPMNELNFFYWIEILPNCQFLYMKRDPFEVYSSIKKKRLKEKVTYTIDNFIVNYLTSLRVAVKLQNKYPERFKIIELNELKSDTYLVMQNISTFLSISYSKILLTPTKLGKPWAGNSMFEKNNSNIIFKTLHSRERESILDETEKKRIEKYIISNKNPIFDFNLVIADFKRYLKLVFLKFRVYLFLNKIIKL